MLERTMREIPKLTDAVIGADINGRPSYDITKTGAADATREAASEAKRMARGTKTGAKRTARQARKVPGVAHVEGQIKGAVAAEQDLAIARYDSLTAEEILSKLPELSQIELAKVDSYERKNRQPHHRPRPHHRAAEPGAMARATMISRSPKSKQ